MCKVSNRVLTLAHTQSMLAVLTSGCRDLWPVMGRAGSSKGLWRCIVSQTPDLQKRLATHDGERVRPHRHIAVAGCGSHGSETSGFCFTLGSSCCRRASLRRVPDLQ